MGHPGEGACLPGDTPPFASILCTLGDSQRA